MRERSHDARPAGPTAVQPVHEQGGENGVSRVSRRPSGAVGLTRWTDSQVQLEEQRRSRARDGEAVGEEEAEAEGEAATAAREEAGEVRDVGEIGDAGGASNRQGGERQVLFAGSQAVDGGAGKTYAVASL